MFPQLLEIGQRLDTEKTPANQLFQIVSAMTKGKKPKPRVFVVEFNERGVRTISPADRDFVMPVAPLPNATNGCGSVRLGYGKRTVFADPQKTKNKQERFLSLLHRTKENHDTPELSSFIKLIETLQKFGKPYEKFIEKLKAEKYKDELIVFRPKDRREPMFAKGTPEAKWWEAHGEDEQIYWLGESVKGGQLHGICSISMDYDILASKLPELPNRTALYSRNRSCSAEVGYQQSEANRMGRRASIYVNHAMSLLMNNKARDGLKTCEVERYGDPADPCPVVHNIWYSKSLGDELLPMGLMMRVDKDENALKFIGEIRERLFRKTTPTAESDTNIHFVQITKTDLGRSCITDYQLRSARQVCENIEKWFRDLQMFVIPMLCRKKGGYDADWFSIYRLREMALTESQLAEREKKPHIKIATFLRCAVDNRNIPHSIATHVANNFLKKMIVGKLYNSEGQYLKTSEAALALLKLYMIRQGYKVSPRFEVENPKNPYWMGALYGVFESNFREGYTCAEGQHPDEKLFHAKFLRQFMQDPQRAIQSLMRNFYVYNEKISKGDPKKSRMIKRAKLKWVSQLFAQLNDDDFRPIESDEDKIWFLFGWYGFACCFNELLDENEPKKEDVRKANPLGELLGLHYLQYQDYLRLSDNPDVFLKKYLSRFLENPAEAFREGSKEGPNCRLVNYQSPGCLENLSEKIRIRKARAGRQGNAKGLSRLADKIKRLRKRIEIPEFINGTEVCSVIRGFFTTLYLHNLKKKELYRGKEEEK